MIHVRKKRKKYKHKLFSRADQVQDPLFFSFSVY